MPRFNVSRPGFSFRHSLQAETPSEEQCDRILQSVLTAAGNTDPVSYKQAALNVENLAMQRSSATAGKIVAFGTGLALVAAGLFLAFTFNSTPAKLLSTIDDDGVPLADSPQLVAPQVYSVSPTAPDGAPAAGEDQSIPVLQGFHVEDSGICIYFSDDGSGVVWEEIYAIDTAGNRLPPLETDPAAGMVKFPLLDGESKIEVFLRDNAGNHAKTTVEINNR